MQPRGTVIRPRKAGLLRQVATRPSVLLWCLFLSLVPFYIIHSGLPQPSDMLAFLVTPIALYGWNFRLPVNAKRSLRILFSLTAWIALVNYGWALALGDTAVLKSYAIFPVYYVFNAVVFLVTLVLYQKHREIALKATFYTILVTVLFQVFISFFYRTGMYRGQLFFNNPNQLGWYALLCASLIALLQRNRRYNLILASVGITGCAYLALLTGSRAALGGIAVLIFLLLFANPRIIVLGSLGALGLITIGGPISHAVTAAEERTLDDRHPNMSFAQERGYDRLWRYPEYMSFGAGEGDFIRFKDTKTSPGEIHSSFATMLFCYGVIGLLLFIWFLLRVIERAPLRESLILMPAMVYMFAHNGLRSPMLWMLLSVFVVLKTNLQSPARVQA